MVIKTTCHCLILHCRFRAEAHLARTRRSTDGDLFRVQFSLRLPMFCRYKNCRDKTTKEAYVHISMLFTTFSLSIKFSNDRIFLVNLSFCSLNGVEVCQIQVNRDVCSSDVSDDVCAGYDAACQTDTGLCQGDCADVIDVCQNRDSK